MKSSEAIKKIASSQSMSVNRLAAICGIYQQTLFKQLNVSSSLRVDSLNKLVDALNYEVVLVPKGSKLPYNSYPIDDRN